MSTTLDNILNTASPDTDNTPSPGAAAVQEGHQTGNATVEPEPPAQTEQSASQEGVSLKNPSFMDMIKPILEEDPLSEKEKKKQKREKIFAAISDGISALSNLYFTTQYAPNMYTGKNTQSQATRERWEKLIKERKEDRNTRLEWMYKA